MLARLRSGSPYGVADATICRELDGSFVVGVNDTALHAS
jgi:hypothetical protein